MLGGFIDHNNPAEWVQQDIETADDNKCITVVKGRAFIRSCNHDFRFDPIILSYAANYGKARVCGYIQYLSFLVQDLLEEAIALKRDSVEKTKEKRNYSPLTTSIISRGLTNRYLAPGNSLYSAPQTANPKSMPALLAASKSFSVSPI